jgi:hypothetical protein
MARKMPATEAGQQDTSVTHRDVEFEAHPSLIAAVAARQAK